MKLNVILPFFSNTPVGGIKVIYEYVNYLVSQGHKVIIYYLPDYCVPFHRIPKSIERKWRKIIQERQTIHWFNLDKRVIRRSVPSINNENIEDADAVLASAIVTALPVSALSEKKGNKVYLIQDFENWGIKDKDVYNTYSVGMCNIVVSKWLKKLVDQYSKSPSILISNGINLNIFKIIVPISQRHRHSIVFHYRNESIKGAKYAIQVVQRLENLYDDLLVYVAKLFRRRTDIRAKWRRKFQHILIDEYQDTNHIQYEIVNVCWFQRSTKVFWNMQKMEKIHFYLQ